MQQIYWRTPMLKCDFHVDTKQLYWNQIFGWLFFCKFAAYFQNSFSEERLERAASEHSNE